MKNLIVLIILISSALAAKAEESVSRTVFENRLQAFSTDGCSQFPDGFPFFKPEWLNCCIVHDLAYWQGGSYAQKIAADEELGQCVANVGGDLLGQAVKLGVSLGGAAKLPTTWHWGYGWIVDRGYAPLQASEKFQVENLLRQIPADLQELPLASPGIIRNRESLTGDHCMDIAVVHIQAHLQRSFKLIDFAEKEQVKRGLQMKTLFVQPEGCTEPFQLTFQLAQRNACRERFKKITEFQARARIRLVQVIVPLNACQ